MGTPVAPPAPVRARRRSRGGLLLTLPLILCVATGGVRADEDGPRAQLNKALDLERSQGDHEGALSIYEKIAELEGQPPDVRADALTGAARCHLAVGSLERAEHYWQRILADAELREEARDWARRKRAEKLERERASGAAGPTEAAVEEGISKYRAEQARRAGERVAEARRALASGRFDRARRLCFEALSLDFENGEAAALLEQIESRRPDRGDILRRLIQFLQTAQLEEYQRLREKVGNLERNGKLAFNKQEYREADQLFREAIRLVDESTFLATGGAMSHDALGTSRMRILQWLRETIDRGSATGLALEAEPPLPDLAGRSGGIQQEFFSLMARVFSPRTAGEEPLRFYDFAPRDKPAGEARRLVSSSFFDGLRATHRTGTLSRARWAERWIRSNIGAHWTDPARPDERGGSRILTRFGSLLCAQHREAEHRRIRQLRDAFASTPPPLRLDVHVFAANAAGAVRVAETLRARAGARESGLDLIVPGRLIEECVKDIADVQDLAQLGSAQVLLDGESSVTLELTRLTEEHPLYTDAPPPALSIPDADARYGLWIDLYAEDMPARTHPGNARSALSVEARILQPADALASHVVPRIGANNLPWTRVPVLTEQRTTADRELPHFATFMMLGLANPFPKTRATLPELIVLIGTRRQDTPTPDPPRPQPSPRIIPEDAQTKEYALGPLAIEVQDDVVPLGWPELRTTADALPLSDRMRLRNEYLALLLGEMANVPRAGPTGADALVIQERRASATLSTEEHVRLEQAVLRLRRHENDLYAVRVTTAVIPSVRWEQWLTLAGVRRNERGNLLATGAGRQTIAQEIQPLAERGGIFNGSRTLLARATQLVSHRSVRARGITKDLRVRLLDHGRQRYTAVPGVAEEGLIVEVRPGIGLPGMDRRSVYVRARAARLDRIESRTYPRAVQEAARYDVPVWHAAPEGSFAQSTDAEILDDGTTLLMALELPGSEDRLVVEVVVTQAQ